MMFVCLITKLKGAPLFSYLKGLIRWGGTTKQMRLVYLLELL